MVAASSIAAQPPWQLPITTGLGLSGWRLLHFAHELRLGARHVGERLRARRVGGEDAEVDRVPAVQRDADLALALEAADAGAVPGARIDDDVGAGVRAQRHARGRADRHQRIVDRPLEGRAVDDDVVVVGEHRRAALLLVVHELVAALAQDVGEQQPALGGVGQVGRKVAGLHFAHGARHCARRLGLALAQLLQAFARRLGVQRADAGQALHVVAPVLRAGGRVAQPRANVADVADIRTCIHGFSPDAALVRVLADAAGCVENSASARVS